MALFYRFTFHANYRSPVPALAYHHICRCNGIPATKMSLSHFEAQMLELKKMDYSSLSVEEYLEAQGGPAGKRMLLTFDDAYESVFENALPLLCSMRFTATLFVITGYIGKTAGWDVALNPARHMSREQIEKAVSLGFSIGSHTLTHPDLTQLPLFRLREELSSSRKKLEDISGGGVTSIAYPFGRYDDRVKNEAEKAGYRAAFTINRPLRQPEFDPLAIPVSGVYGIDGTAEFMAKVGGGRGAGLLMLRDKIINRFASGTTLVKSPEYRT